MRAWSPGEGLHAIVLAAGGSSRLGSPKQLIEVQGRPLVRRYVDMANALCGRQVVVVTGAAQRAVESMLAGVAATMIPNPDWQIGLSTSVRTGLRALPKDAAGALLMLADQALLQADSLKGLISAWRQQPDRIAAARYAGSLGVPAIFPQRLFPDLLGLRGDRGAKQILRVRAQVVTGIVMPDAEFDLDTKTDLKQLREMEARSAAKQEIDPASELQVLEMRRSIRVRDAHPAPTLQTRYTCPFDFQ